MNPIRSLAEKALAVIKKTDWVALLVARLTVGLEFVSTGWGKVHNLAKVTAFFTELKIPMPGFNAVLASYTELICGALLVLGVASRLAAAPLIVTMVVALVTAKATEIHDPFDLVGELEWAYLAILVVMVSLGPGAASLDGVIAKLRPPARAPAKSAAA
jgi:putative oxidoreductase